MSDELPEGWALTTLGEGLIIDVQPGFACGSHNTQGKGVPHLRPMNVSEEGRIDLSTLKYVPEDQVYREERLIRAGEILFNNTNSPELVGKTAFYTDPVPRAFSNHMTRVRCRQEVLDPKYCAAALHQKWRERYFESVCNNHVSQASVSRTVLLTTPIMLPPLAEQKRIVAKVEELLARVSAARERLSRVPAILKRFRQSVLAAACSGRLTSDWREKQGIIAKQVEVVDGLEMPDAWTNRRTADLVEPGTVISYGIVLPGPNLSEGVPYIRGQDIDDSGRVHVEQLYKTSLEIAAKHQRSLLQAGDVLLCVIRHFRVAIVPQELEGANLTQGTVRMRPSVDVLGTYLARYLASPQAQSWMKQRIVGTDMPRINVEHARAIPVPLPLLAEQREIVRRVEALFALAGVIEERVSAASLRVDKIIQAILAKAFRGELVPTEAELARQEGRKCEPAADLLERIRAERTASSPSPAKRPARRRQS
jgi:type I restriction enzyme S subunit